MRTFLVGGSPAAGGPGLAPGPGDRVIAADRGAQHARAWGWPVAPAGRRPGLAAACRGAAVACGRHAHRHCARPPRMRPTWSWRWPTRLAEGAQTIVICAALGGRTDHLLANVLLLARPDLAGLDVCIADGAGDGAPAARQRRTTRPQSDGWLARPATCSRCCPSAGTRWASRRRAALSAAR